MSNCGCKIEIKSKEESRVLIILLLINAVMFITELTLGWLGEPTGLIADSLDMLADALVYGVGLYAVDKSDIRRLTQFYSFKYIHRSCCFLHIKC